MNEVRPIAAQTPVATVASAAPSTSASRCYEHIVKACVQGHNIQKYAERTVDECVALCDVNPACVAFEYGVDHGGNLSIEEYSVDKYRPGDCQPQSSMNYQRCDGAHYNLDLYVKSGCAPTVAPYDLGTPSRAPSQPDCNQYSAAACERSALSHSLTLGGAGWAFIGDYVTKGCYFYPVSHPGPLALRAYYGTINDTELQNAQQLGMQIDDVDGAALATVATGVCAAIGRTSFINTTTTSSSSSR
eukprot:gene58050-biopygen40803